MTVEHAETRNAPRCNVSGKEMFETKQEARSALSEYGWRKGSRTIHRCIFCDHYHMTKNARHGGKRRR